MQTAARASQQIPSARFMGEQWVVAMTDADWETFCALPIATNCRFCKMFECFCASGERDLPKACVHWMTPAADTAARRNIGAFEAYGVIIQGRRAPQGTPAIFCVTKILTEKSKPPTRGGRRTGGDERQSPLPFDA